MALCDPCPLVFLLPPALTRNTTGYMYVCIHMRKSLRVYTGGTNRHYLRQKRFTLGGGQQKDQGRNLAWLEKLWKYNRSANSQLLLTRSLYLSKIAAFTCLLSSKYGRASSPLKRFSGGGPCFFASALYFSICFTASSLGSSGKSTSSKLSPFSGIENPAVCKRTTSAHLRCRSGGAQQPVQATRGGRSETGLLFRFFRYRPLLATGCCCCWVVNP